MKPVQPVHSFHKKVTWVIFINLFIYYILLILSWEVVEGDLL